MIPHYDLFVWLILSAYTVFASHLQNLHFFLVSTIWQGRTVECALFYRELKLEVHRRYPSWNWHISPSIWTTAALAPGPFKTECLVETFHVESLTMCNCLSVNNWARQISHKFIISTNIGASFQVESWWYSKQTYTLPVSGDDAYDPA